VRETIDRYQTEVH